MPVTFEVTPPDYDSASSNEDVSRPGGSGPKAANADVEIGGDGGETFYVQVVNQQGEIETVPVHQDREEDFDTNRGLLGYLAEKGELLRAGGGGDGGGEVSTAGTTAASASSSRRRGSIFPEGLLPRRSSKEDIKRNKLTVEAFDLDKSLQRQRSGSIMTPGLLLVCDYCIVYCFTDIQQQQKHHHQQQQTATTKATAVAATAPPPTTADGTKKNHTTPSHTNTIPAKPLKSRQNHPIIHHHHNHITPTLPKTQPYKQPPTHTPSHNTHIPNTN